LPKWIIGQLRLLTGGSISGTGGSSSCAAKLRTAARVCAALLFSGIIAQCNRR
jgi:hypothetical protein